MAAEKRDYYEVLGVDKSASEDEIKKGVHLMVDTHIFDQSSSSARFLS